MAKSKKNAFTVPLARPDITGKEIRTVLAVLRTPYLSFGPRLEEFEKKFAAYTGSRYAVAVNSGTAGLHLAIKSLEIDRNDAVITTPFSFIASANCILYENALPVFIDINEDTFNIDSDLIQQFLKKECRRDRKSGRPVHRKSGRTVKAVLPVHVFGNPCEMHQIMELAREYKLSVIEDACEAVGAEYHGKRTGSIGDVGVFAFYPNKQITTGEGGIITTNNENVANLCKSLRNQGRDHYGGWLAHRRLGYNYRISDINCALGISQLERIEEILQKREKIAFMYNALLNGFVKTPETQNRSKRSWFVYVICLPDEYEKETRDDILAKLTDRGIGCSNYFPPIHLQPFYRETFGYTEGDYCITERISARTIALPFHNNLKKSQIAYVTDNLKDILNIT
ncbi:MAG: DegT/DnrJ/EryC1/StrS family aminotransferase [Nitrospirota bacterium]